MRLATFIFFVLFSVVAYSQEICNNAIDDDADGLIDLLDSVDCSCGGFGFVTNVPSLIPNPSFEQMSNCPTNYGQISNATNWIMASDANQTSYLNTCGYLYNSVNQGGLIPFPDGNGIAAAFIQEGWTEYIASCLSQPLIAGQYYTIQLKIVSNPIQSNQGVIVNLFNNGIINYSAMDICIFGTNNCGNLPFTGYGCPPSSTWDLLGTATYTPSGNWGTLSLNFVPSVDINAIAIGAPCAVPPSYPDLNQIWCPVFYFDNILLNKTDFFSMVQVTSTGLHCTNNLQLIASSDTSGGSWQWYKNGIALISETNAMLDLSLNNYGFGKYTARYSNGIDCGTFSYEYFQPNIPFVDFTSDKVFGCNPLTIVFKDSINMMNVNCLWDFGDGSFSTECGTIDHIYQEAGIFNVSLTVMNQDSCVVTKTYPNYVIIKPQPKAQFLYSPETISTVNNYLYLENNSLYASTYAWNFNDIDTSSKTNPIYEILSINNGTFDVTLIAKNDFNCSDTLTQTVNVKNESIYFAPNTFTPNGDGVNDVFKPIFALGFIPIDYLLNIYDRWGHVIFSTKDYNASWDGSNCMNGYYIWQMKFISLVEQDENNVQGTVELLK